MILDTDVFVLVERMPGRLVALLERFADEDFVTNEAVMAQVWRTPQRQSRITRFLYGFDIEVEPIGGGQALGVLLGRSCTRDVIDASVALTGNSRNDVILTSNSKRLANLGAITVKM